MNLGISLIIGIIGSIIAAVLIRSYVRYRKNLLKKRKRIIENCELVNFGQKFYEQGLTKFHFSRDDYGRTLATFLDTAVNSIFIVSISLKITDDEGQLSYLFKRKLSANSSFSISISLINPNNQELIKVASDTLNVSKEKLYNEIIEMLKDLLDCYESLNSSERSRFKILVHDCFPMGSVIMLDATPTSGMIQIETKLYKAPRTASFGFQLTKESPFFKHNFVAWQRVFQESKPFTREHLGRKKSINNKNLNRKIK